MVVQLQQTAEAVAEATLGRTRPDDLGLDVT